MFSYVNRTEGFKLKREFVFRYPALGGDLSDGVDCHLE